MIARRFIVLALLAVVAACSEELDPALHPPSHDADAGAAKEDSPVAGAGVPAPHIGLMGEAEMTEYFIRTFELADENGILDQIKAVPINAEQTVFEHYSFSFDVRRSARYDYQNMMPTSRDLATFSQTTASGLFALGSHFCIVLFNREYAQAARKRLFGIEDFAYDAEVPKADSDRILDVLIDKFVASSAVDLEPVRADVRKIMLDEFDEAVGAGVRPRDALEETCAVLVGSLAPYLL